MEKQKFYFKDVNDTICVPLEEHLHDAIIDGLTEVTVVEAIPDNDNPDYVWCQHYGEVAERCNCTKKECSHYTSKSGRGKCSNRGNLFLHGDQITFAVSKD